MMRVGTSDARSGEQINGALLVDKPGGLTSHDVVARVRRALRTPRIGHTGTLDPLATGLLVLLVGHATRFSQFLVTDEKEYVAGVRLGQSTPTYDAQGLDEAMREAGGARLVTPEQIEALLPDFLGTFPQVPPPFSAKKVDGVRAYKKARQHEPVELKAVQVTVRELEIVADHPPTSHLAPRNSDPTLVRLRIVCSAGFYVRSLAHDLGQRLGCGAHLESLRRTRVGRFRLDDATPLEALESDPAGALFIPLNTLLEDAPAVLVTDEGSRRASHGNTLGPSHLVGPVPPGSPPRVRLLDGSGTLLAVARMGSDALLHPLIVLG